MKAEITFQTDDPALYSSTATHVAKEIVRYRRHLDENLFEGQVSRAAIARHADMLERSVVGVAERLELLLKAQEK